MLDNSTEFVLHYSHDSEKLMVVITYAVVAVVMSIPYCFSLYIIQRNKSIYDLAFRLFALNMGFSDLQLMVIVGFSPAVTYFLPSSVPFEVYKVFGAFGADAWFTYAMLAQMMSLNRFVCVFWPVKAKIIYIKRNILIILIFCWIQGLIWASFYLKPNVAIYFDLDQKGFMYDFRLDGTEALFFANTIFNYVHVASLCFIYGLIYVKIRRDRKQILDPCLSNDRMKENKVLIQASVICSMDITVVATWAIFQKFSTAKYALFVANIIVLSTCGSTGYLYILMNNAVRQKFGKIISQCCHYKASRTPKHKIRKYDSGIQSAKKDTECIEFMDTDVML